MTDAKKPEEKSKYYFGVVPKEEFPKFMERLKAALDKKENKKGEKKAFDFEIRGTKEEINGLALEIFSFDKSRCAEFLDVNAPHIKEGLYCASLNFEVLQDTDVDKVKMAFEQFKPMISAIPFLQNKFELSFRNNGKKVSFDLVCKDGKLVKAVLDLGIDFSEYHKFNFALKSGINLEEIFDPNADQNANLIKIFSFLFSIKSETENVKYLSGALAEALKDVKLSEEKVQKKFDKVVGFINFVNSFIGAKINLEYDAKTLAGESGKQAEKMAGGEEGLKKKISGTQQMALGMGQNMIAPMIQQFGMADTVKSLNLDYLALSVGVPKYGNGYAISIKLPGLSKVLAGMLNPPK